MRLQQQLGSARCFAHEGLTATEEQERIARRALQLQQNSDTAEQQQQALAIAAAAAAARTNVPRASRPVLLHPGETTEQRRARLDARNARDWLRRANRSTAELDVRNERDRLWRANRSTTERQVSNAARNEGDRQHRTNRSTIERDSDNAARATQTARRTDEQRARHAVLQANARAQQPATYKVARNFPIDGSVPQHDLGCMEHECPHCKALHWAHERTKGSINTGSASYGMCCMHGAVRLPALRATPEPLNTLLKGEIAEAKHFLYNIRHYNATFQMASTGALAF